MKDVLTWHRAHYPLLQAEDVVKLTFQAHLGCGHLLATEDEVTSRIEAEEAALMPDAHQALTEPLGENYLRLNLRRAMAEGIAPRWIARIMALSCQLAPAHTRQEVIQALDALLPEDSGVPHQSLRAAAACVADDGWLPSHSDVYRAAYAPAYRVVHREMALLLPVLAAIARQACKPRLMVAIDGPCASGKTTLAARLSFVLGGAPVAHMDDFFTPHAEKTPQRLAQPGGNADVARFTAEFLTPWLRDGHASYRPYNCHEDKLLDPISLPAHPVTLVEGAYCLHPLTGRPYDVQVFLHVSPEAQRQRILQRNGPGMWERFRTEWIPLEQAYFSAFSLPDAQCISLPQGDQCCSG